MVRSFVDGWGESHHRKALERAALLPPYAQAQPALYRAAPFLPGRVGRRDSVGPSLCVGLFHSHTPSSVAAAIATAARLVALRISLRTAVLAHVSFSFCMSPSSLFCLFGVDPNGSQNFGRLVNDRV